MIVLSIATVALSAGSASARVVDVASDPFIDLVAVDGGSVYYSKRAADNGGIPLTVHRFDLATGADVAIRTYNDSDWAISSMKAGGGYLVIVESSATTVSGRASFRAITIKTDGTSPRELISQQFFVNTGGTPLGTIAVERVTGEGEAILRVTDLQKAQNKVSLSLIGFRSDGTSATYLSTDRHPNRLIRFSDKFLVWWTLHRVGVAKLGPNGKTHVRRVRNGVYGAAVDDSGRLLLTTFLGRGRNSNQLHYFASLESNKSSRLYSAWKSLAVGHFCGARLFIARQLAGSDPREITEINPKGERVNTLYRAPNPVSRSGARGFTCSSDASAWLALKSPSDGGLWNLTVQASDFAP